ncbi:hypothetical protein Q8F55_008592 [Vanrija albida]|uniref:Uncharacterized protein n=1 Tax=Vanrija albida TaxID=181172 RepID=A0ABR3PR93_9TREE
MMSGWDAEDDYHDLDWAQDSRVSLYINATSEPVSLAPSSQATAAATPDAPPKPPPEYFDGVWSSTCHMPYVSPQDLLAHVKAAKDAGKAASAARAPTFAPPAVGLLAPVSLAPVTSKPKPSTPRPIDELARALSNTHFELSPAPSTRRPARLASDRSVPGLTYAASAGSDDSVQTVPDELDAAAADLEIEIVPASAAPPTIDPLLLKAYRKGVYTFTKGRYDAVKAREAWVAGTPA